VHRFCGVWCGDILYFRLAKIACPLKVRRGVWEVAAGQLVFAQYTLLHEFNPSAGVCYLQLACETVCSTLDTSSSVMILPGEFVSLSTGTVLRREQRMNVQHYYYSVPILSLHSHQTYEEEYNLGYVASLCYVDMWIHSHQILTRHRNIIHSDYLVAVVYTHRPARSSIFYALLLVELGNTPQEER
jgi:hypothetical protein